MTIHVSSAHAREDVTSFLLFPESKRKYEVGGTRTHDISFVGYIEVPTELHIFASVRAGDVNGYDSLPLSTMVVRGEGREPWRSLLRSR